MPGSKPYHFHPEAWAEFENAEDSLTSAAEAALKEPVIAALKRCATQNQVLSWNDKIWDTTQNQAANL